MEYNSWSYNRTIKEIVIIKLKNANHFLNKDIVFMVKDVTSFIIFKRIKTKNRTLKKLFLWK